MILFINDWGTEDLGSQWAYDGLCELLGWEQVIDWPSNRYCHAPQDEEPSNDSHLSWPERRFHEWEIRDLLMADRIDLVIIDSARDIAHGTAMQLRHWFGRSRLGVVLLDLEDYRHLTVTRYLEVPEIRQHVVLIGKRELMPDFARVTAGIPIVPVPFSYPATRQYTPARPANAPLVFYHAHDWGWDADSPRHRLIRVLNRIRAECGFLIDAGLSEEASRVGRVPVREYRARLRAARCGIALNARGGSDNNRYWETVAAGCVLISDRPRHVIPDNFVDGEEAFFVDEFTMETLRPLLQALAADPARAHRVAAAGQAKWLAQHTTAARMRTLLATVGYQV